MICCGLLAVPMMFMAGCTSDDSGVPEYDINSRTAMDEGEIAYEAAEQETYYNYIELYDDKGNIYQIGDPFVMRFDGKYYLYSSLTGGNIESGIPCWVSDNLVDWEFAAWVYGDGTSGSGGEIAYTAYAPEVVYYRGYFYMCEAPRGQGHYILRASSPTSQFEVVSDNLGLGIDGSFYADKEGNLYLVSAISGYSSEGSIFYTQLLFDDDGKVSAGTRKSVPVAVMGGWTEGPGYFERNGYQYLTYTGNHVDSASYRVAYASTEDDFLFDGLTTKENNIILLSTGDDALYSGGGYASDENFVGVSTYRGLGHSSNVTGPNLDSEYIAYHNAGRQDHTGVTGNGFNRRYNVAQLLTNKSDLMVNGLCTYATPKPTGADFTAYGAEELTAQDGFVLSEDTGAVYTAELNFALSQGKGSVIVGWTNATTYTEISVNGTELTLSRIRDNVRETLATATISESDNAEALHTVKVVNGYASAEVHYDGLVLISLGQSLSGAGKIGASQDIRLGSVSFTNDAFGTGDFESVKNLTASFPAYTYLKTENRGFQIANASLQTDGVRQGEKEQTKTVNAGGNATAVTLQADDWVKYAVNAPESGTYALYVDVAKVSDGCIFEVIIDEEHIYKMEITDAIFPEEGYLRVYAGTFSVDGAGIHSMKIRVFHGTLDMTTLSTQTDAEAAGNFSNALTDSFEQGKVVIGNVSYGESGLTTSQEYPRTMVYFGGKGVPDFELSVKVTLLSGAAGIVFRTKNFSYTQNVATESHAFQGYYLRMDTNSVILYKYNYSQERLGIAAPTVDGDRAFSLGRTNIVTVRMVQNKITVMLNGAELFTYTDQTPFMDGYCGFYTEGTRAAFADLTYTQL